MCCSMLAQAAEMIREAQSGGSKTEGNDYGTVSKAEFCVMNGIDTQAHRAVDLS